MTEVGIPLAQLSLHDDKLAPRAELPLNTLPEQVRRLAQSKEAHFTLMVVGESGVGKTTFLRSLFGAEFTVTKAPHQPLLPASQTAHPVAPGAPNAITGSPQSTASQLISSVATIGVPDVLNLGLSLQAAGEPNAAAARSDVHRTAEIEVYQAVLSETSEQSASTAANAPSAGAFATKLTVIDTPGFGDFTNNANTWVPVVDYIDAQHQHVMLQREQPERRRLVDTRVHLCLYFLAPTSRILELDLVAMRELCTRVNLVPVIAKADSLTPEDLAEFRVYTRAVLAKNGIRVWLPSTNEAANEAANASGSTANSSGSTANATATNLDWPLALVSSDKMVVNSAGQEVRGRKYRWGTIEIENPQHSDFARLRDLLFRDGMLDLIDTTNNDHYVRMRRRLRLLRLQRALMPAGYAAKQMKQVKAVLPDPKQPEPKQPKQSKQPKQAEKAESKQFKAESTDQSIDESTNESTLSLALQSTTSLASIQSTRLAPEDRASLGFLHSKAFKPAGSDMQADYAFPGPPPSPQEPAEEEEAMPESVDELADINPLVLETAATTSGLKQLRLVHDFGRAFLNAERFENDALLHQRAQALKQQFEVVARFQEERFDAQARVLEGLRNELNAEIAGLNAANLKLAQDVQELELKTKKRR